MMERLKCVLWIEQSKSGHHQFAQLDCSLTFNTILAHQYIKVGQIICH